MQENETSEKLEVSKSKKPKSIDMENELEKFKSMLDKGLISEEDYEAKKKDILGL